jgi:hypothetical protein
MKQIKFFEGNELATLYSHSLSFHLISNNSVMLEACLDFSKCLVEARKAGNHDKKPVDTYDHDKAMATYVAAITECKKLMIAIKQKVDEKQNKRFKKSSVRAIGAAKR